MTENTAKFEIFYDGDCPLCRREIDMVKRKDRQNRVEFTDIAAPTFDPDSVGKSFDELMAEIHGRRANGDWVVGVEAFRDLYTAIGWGRLVSVTRVPGISHLLDIGYRWFAKRRLKFTGRCNESCSVSLDSSSRTETKAVAATES